MNRRMTFRTATKEMFDWKKVVKTQDPESYLVTNMLTIQTPVLDVNVLL